MAANRCGRVIKKIKVLKNKVVITFTNDETFEISKETYTFFYFYEGKEISATQYKNIKKADETNKYLSIAIRLATETLMPEAKLMEKLAKRGASKPVIEAVMKIMKQNDIINDQGYIQDYLEYANEVLYGEKKIKDCLIKKGVDQDKVNKIHFSKANELKKAKQLTIQQDIKLKKYSYPIRKRKIYSHLLNSGFVSEIALQALKSIKKDENDKLIDEELNQAIKAWLKVNESKYDSDSIKFNKLCAYLKRKGYSYSKIKEVWGKNYVFD